MRIKINKLLIKAGISTHYKGFKILGDAITLYDTNSSICEIYEHLAIQDNCKACSIDRNIRYCIEKTWINKNNVIINQLYTTYGDKKPNNELFISFLYMILNDLI